MRKICLLSVLLLMTAFLITGQSKPGLSVSSVGIRMVAIPPGTFMMGETNRMTGPMKCPAYLVHGDWDERPVRNVTISRPFRISETEITVEQYKHFDPEYIGQPEWAPYVSGISWHEAASFCEWLSRKEGTTYRLPTEAEWEYVCRSGTTTLFQTGDSLTAKDGDANPWGVKNMHTGVSEWCFDWYGMYPDRDQTDPVGPKTGHSKVVRGGGLDQRTDFYARSANRSSMCPSFPPVANRELLKMAGEYEKIHGFVEHEAVKPEGFHSVVLYLNFVREKSGLMGRHSIGFRVVEGALPDSPPVDAEAAFSNVCIRQNRDFVKTSPDMSVPYFRKRYLLPTPPENIPDEEIQYNAVTGLHPALLSHNHCPALAACPNGDLIAVYYTSVGETSPDVALLISRLRFGAEQWDMPGLFLDLADVDDHGPLFWTEGETLRFFWGANKLPSGFPFQWMESADSGATWSEPRFPVFRSPVGGHSAQLVNTAFRDRRGVVYIASDGVGPESVLWKSFDNGQTWIDPGGRTGGRHTTFVPLKDGRILGLGGKSSDVSGFMPRSISKDGGETWEVSSTPFAALGSGQRPVVLRLASGRLLFAGDLQDIRGNQPEGIKERGCCAALSEDEGETWTIKKLVGTQLFEDPSVAAGMKGQTLGYAVARQAPNGMIHLITSMNQPCLHLEFNEAWILDPSSDDPGDAVLMRSKAQKISEVKTFEERYASGQVKAVYSGGIADDGRFLLDGKETWSYPDGTKKYEVTRVLGEKRGLETYYDPDGRKVWTWEHDGKGASTWIRYYPNGAKKTQSTWIKRVCTGSACEWDRNGKLLRRAEFENGRIVKAKRMKKG